MGQNRALFSIKGLPADVVPWCLALTLAILGSALATPVEAQQRRTASNVALDPYAAQMVGVWEVFQTKEPGHPYKASYKEHPFVAKGANAFTLFFEYRKDGTFRRITRVGSTETIQEGSWKMSGHELRHERPGALEEEVMFIRFDNPDQYTSIDVYEGSPDPGLFGRFKRVK